MGGRDHSCEECGRGGLNDPDGRCICADDGQGRHSRRAVEYVRDAIEDYIVRRYGVTSQHMPDEEVEAVIDAYVTQRGFRDLQADIKAQLDEHYPVDMIPGPYRAGADPGVRFVVKLREALAELPDA